MRRVSLLAVVLTLGLAATPSCVLVAESGAAVEIALSVVGGPAVSADGLAVSLDEAALAIEDGWLEPCDDATARASRSPRPAALGTALETALETLLAPGLAHALHPGAEGVALGQPHVVALHDPPPALGVVHPAPGAYCALTLLVMPSPELDGWALRARGTVGGAPMAADGYGMRRWQIPLEGRLEVLERGASTVELELDPAGAVGDVAMADAEPEACGFELLLALESRARARPSIE